MLLEHNAEPTKRPTLSPAGAKTRGPRVHVLRSRYPSQPTPRKSDPDRDQCHKSHPLAARTPLRGLPSTVLLARTLSFSEEHHFSTFSRRTRDL